MDQETGVLETITPSEPVVAKAAMEFLCQGTNWSYSIETLIHKLPEKKELIEKGLKGELYPCLVLILAHDSLRNQRAFKPT